MPPARCQLVARESALAALLTEQPLQLAAYLDSRSPLQVVSTLSWAKLALSADWEALSSDKAPNQLPAVALPLDKPLNLVEVVTFLAAKT